VTEKDLIAACIKKNRKAQQLLFDQYSPTMNGTLKRYLKRTEDREDVLVEAFYKVLTNIDQFKGNGSFEGWIRRIIIN
jgi:RNA polymerase sigma-70 factor (ECF subfamily)